MSSSSSASVPASPVVRIEIFGSTVSVNGVVILHDGTQPLHQVAIQAASDRVAKPLGRPVRALATDAEGSASMVVHPDGRATDVELLEADVAPPAPAPVENAPTAPMFAQLDPAAIPSTPPPAVAPAARTTAPLPVAAGGSSSGLPSKVVRSVALAAALVAVVGMGVLLLGSRDDDGDAETATERSSETSPVAAGSSEAAEETTTFEVPGVDDTPEITVTPMPGAKALRLTIVSTVYPTTATVTVSGKDKPLDVPIEGASTEVDIDRLTPGSVQWSVEVPGAPLASGQVDISDTFVRPTPAPTETAAPVETVDPALIQAQAEAKAAREAAREAKREARQAQQQARQQQQAKQQQQQKQSQQVKKKETKKVKTGFGKVKKTRTGFRD